MAVLAVTVGDPAGIGPEVTEKAIAAAKGAARVIVVGPDNVAGPMAERLGVESHTIGAFAGPVAVASAASGRAALDTLAAGIALCKSGRADGLVTAPISKQALALAGSADRGHTEILTREMATGPTAMAFFSPQLRTVLATVHVPLAQAIRQLSSSRIVEVARLFSATMRVHLGIASPNLALAALNPHAGEDGLLGDDEKRILEPAVAEARAVGVRLSGPFPADTLFRRAVDGEFDGVVALYHDQALIPVKLLGFGDAVNVTLGLTHPRTSPDHGTAYDIVGKNQARPAGMLSALQLAVELCAKR